MNAYTTPPLASRLPRVGTTIFSVMSALAQEHGAVNLGQGFPDFACDPLLVDAVTEAMRQGHNQYPAMPGVLKLREALSEKILRLYGQLYDANSEITITAGATQAILTSVMAIVHPGDEVILLTPSYDSYEPSITMAGGVTVHVPLQPGTFRPDFAAIKAALTPRTRALLINSPHNPSGTVWSRQELLTLQELLRPTNVVVISDEVYEHMVFDGQAHQSVACFPELAARSILISSFGKTYHVTGWKVGYVAAPASLTQEFRKVHQFNVFTVNTPMQWALASFMKNASHYLDLPAFYQRKRDLFRQGLVGSRFELLACEGSYFQCVRYRSISEQPEDAFCRWLTREVGVAAIPISAFYPNGFEQGLIRFCFAKKDETLLQALDRLQRL